MALIFIDSFDHYSSDEQGDKQYSPVTAGGQDIGSVGRRGTQGLYGPSPAAAEILSFPVAITDDTIVVGIAFKRSAYDNQQIFTLREVGGSSKYTVSTTSGGAIKISNNVASTSTQTSDTFFTLNTYHFIELKIYKHALDGYVECRKSGVKILELTSQDTTAGSIDSMSISGQGTQSLDDLYVLDGTGTTNNDYLGDVRVDVYYMTSDGTTTDFIPFVAGDNFLMVDEALTDNDGSFIEAGTVGAQEYHKTSQALLGTEIYGVQHVVGHRKTDAGSVTMNLKTNKPGGSGVKTHTEDQSGDDYKFTTAIFDTDPDDGGTWTDSRINATEWGFSIVDITT